MTYQWRFDGVALSDQTNATLLVTNAQFQDSGRYDVEVSNSFGAVVSLPVALNILINPVFTVQPLGQSVGVGGSVTLSVAVSGSPPPFAFEWRMAPPSLARI